MSDITGNGWGASHDWKGHTPQDNSKRTIYECAACEERFVHHYDETPNIFTAMHNRGVSDKCKAPA